MSMATVHVRSWQGAYVGLIPQSYLDALRPEDRVGMWEETLKELQWPRTGAIVLLGPSDGGTDEGPINGFVSFSATRDEDAEGATVGEILTFYLDPTSFGSGGADLLMSAALVALRAAAFTKATLWVLETNTRARRFYERRGWQPDGINKLHDWVDFVATDVRYAIDLASGDLASGDLASGDLASGDLASGDLASGDLASGDLASGDLASGDLASGDLASGDLASGDLASGDLASGDLASGPGLGT
jgi:ribosomal protein S18 acetylase RimI-like enzyme